MALPGTPAFITIYDDKVDELMRSDEARALVGEAAAKAASIAQGAAPYHYGDYRESIHAGDMTPSDGGVATAWFGSDDSTWHIIEFGNATTPTYRTLTAAAEQAGLQFKPER